MKKLLVLIAMFAILAMPISCDKSSHGEDDIVNCGCSYPEWAQRLLQEERTPQFFPLLMYAKYDGSIYYAIYNVYDSNMLHGVTFYDSEGNEIKEDNPLFDTFFGMLKSADFKVCEHQFHRK